MSLIRCCCIRFSGTHRFPNGSVGQHFIHMLSSKLRHFALGHYSAECCLVFGSIILQQDMMIKMGCDICHLLEKQLQLWWEEKFDILLQEVICCNLSDLFVLLIVGHITLKIM